MPAITFWSVMTVLIRPLLPASTAAKSSGLSDSASGPSAAMPGTLVGSSTSHTANRFCVPASVRSKPGASPGVPRWTRNAIGPLPGLSGAAASLSDQRSQPARDRWVMRCSSPACRPRYLPHRLAPVTSRPYSAVVGGSKVLSTERADTSTRLTGRPTACRRRWSASASTSGSSGMNPVCPNLSQMMPDSMNIADLRAITPGCQHRNHLNNAGAALLSAPTIAAMTHQLQLEAHIGGYEAAEAATDQIDDTYRALGELVGASAA